MLSAAQDVVIQACAVKLIFISICDLGSEGRITHDQVELTILLEFRLAQVRAEAALVGLDIRVSIVVQKQADFADSSQSRVNFDSVNVLRGKI